MVGGTESYLQYCRPLVVCFKWTSNRASVSTLIKSVAAMQQPSHSLFQCSTLHIPRLERAVIPSSHRVLPYYPMSLRETHPVLHALEPWCTLALSVFLCPVSLHGAHSVSCTLGLSSALALTIIVRLMFLCETHPMLRTLGPWKTSALMISICPMSLRGHGLPTWSLSIYLYLSRFLL